MILSETGMKRDTYIDSVKTVLIFCVVLGHCLIRNGGGTIDENIALNFIYIFHMPLFVFVSGYLFNPERPWKKVLWGCLELLLTYLLFQWIWLILNRTPISFKQFAFPQFALWYLLSLAFWRTMLKTIASIWSNKLIWLILSFFLSAGFFFIPFGRVLSFQRTFSFFPFFVTGVLCRNTIAVDYVRKIDKRLTVFVLIGLIIVLSQIGKPPFWLLTGRSTVYDYPFGIMVSLVVRGIWYMMVFIVSICILNLIPDTVGLARNGGNTLPVYLLHFFPIWILQRIGIRSDSLLVVSCWALAITVTLLFSGRYHCIKILTNPLSLYHKK